ncbi:16S rRNA (guanine(966)-N(2))-methyltransferase RsmD [Sphingomonas sp.]|uniref:16S rRNA (guanine(966)-N(2))-methyltransferase RsmD n=1 Tax=Sphingomonas sp. TaxID=28214 RepID=UPI00286C2A64|nr:16S rRNA (guanine(966)-N(2))-methyltransferase RsmD [Sphingomonas sp.]
MRIISGAWRGRKLIAPAGLQTRPTADRTRETLFSMLASRLGSFDALRVADLYAGSGALGLEALSRGAVHCTFVENDRAATDAIRANAATLGATGIDIMAMSAARLPRAQPVHLILADPPYADGSGSAAVASVVAAEWLAPGGWMAVETERGASVDPGPLSLEVERDTGRARLTLLRLS